MGSIVNRRQTRVLLKNGNGTRGVRGGIDLELMMVCFKFRHSSTNQHSSEWIAGPNGYLYQVREGRGRERGRQISLQEGIGLTRSGIERNEVINSVPHWRTILVGSS